MLQHHSHPRVQLQHRHHHGHQQQPPQRHTIPVAVSAGTPVLLSGIPPQQQPPGLYSGGSSGSSTMDHFKCPQCTFLTAHGDELEKHFRDVHLTNLLLAQQQQQQMLNGLGRSGAALGGGQQKPIQSANERFGFAPASSSLAALDESTVAAAKAMLSISATSSSPVLANQISGGKFRRNQSMVGVPPQVSNRNEAAALNGNVLIHSVDPNNLLLNSGAAYAKSIDTLRYLQQQQQQRTSYVTDEPSGECSTAAILDPNFRPCFYGLNVNSSGQQATGRRLQANIAQLQQRNANQLPQVQQHHLNGIENLASADINALAKTIKAAVAAAALPTVAPPPSGSATAFSPTLNAADMSPYWRQLLALAVTGVNHNAASPPNAAAAASQLDDKTLHVIIAHQLMQNPQVASQLLGGIVNASTLGGNVNANANVNMGAAGVGAYLPLRPHPGDVNMAAALATALYQEQHQQQQQVGVRQNVGLNDVGRQNVNAGVTACGGGVGMTATSGRSNINVVRQNVVNVDVSGSASGRQKAPLISPLVTTSTLRPSPRSGGGVVADASAGRLAPMTALHDGTGSMGGAVARRHSMLPAISGTRTRVTATDGTAGGTVTSPTSRSGSMSTLAEEIEQHISRIISQNESIIEPSPILAKRRTYTRQQLNPQPPQHSSSQSLSAAVQPSSSMHLPSSQSPPSASAVGRSSSYVSSGGGSSTNSCDSSPPLPRESRSNSLYSSFSPAMTSLGLRHQRNATTTGRQLVAGKSSTTDVSGDAVTAAAASTSDGGSSAATLRFLAQVETETLRATEKLFACQYCRLSVRHADDLRRHEEKCARRSSGVGVAAGVREVASTSPTGASSVAVVVGGNGGSSKGPLKKRLLAAAEHEATTQGSESTKLDSLLPLPLGTPGKKANAGQSTPGVLSQQRRASSFLTSAVQQPYTLTHGDMPPAKPEMTKVTQCFAGRRMNHALLPCVTSPSNAGDGGAAAAPPAKRSRNEYHSLYAHWHQLPVHRNEALKNLLRMNACHLRLHYAPLRYSQARSNASDMRIISSTYYQCEQLKWSLAAQRLLGEQQPYEKMMSDLVVYCSDAAAAATTSSRHGITVASTAGAEHLTPIGDVDSGGADYSSLCCYASPGQRRRRPRRRRRVYRRFVVAASSLSPPPRRLSSSSLTCRQRRRRSSIVRSRSLSAESDKITLDMDSDETMSHDGLCVVTDDEEETCCRTGQVSSDLGLLRELRQKLKAFGIGWERMITNGHTDPSCISPFLVDHFLDDVVSAPSSPSHHQHCRSAPLLPPGFSRLDGDDGVVVAVGDASSGAAVEQKTLPGDDEDADDGRRAFSAFRRPPKATTTTTPGLEAIWRQEPANRNITAVRTGELSKNVCPYCSTRFPNFGSYSLHMTAHAMEKPSSKRYEYMCRYCSTKCRSRNLLQKHISMAHPQKPSQPCGPVESDQSSSKDLILLSPREKGLQSPASQNQQTFGPGPSQMMSSNDPRPFKCQYCEIAFRIHGHLAKHLRSKAHIMKLECLDKVPPGTFAMLEECKTDKFSLIDTSDCQNSLESLLKLADEMQLIEKCPAVDHPTLVGKTAHCSNVLTSTANIPSLVKCGAAPPQISVSVPSGPAPLNFDAVPLRSNSETAPFSFGTVLIPSNSTTERSTYGFSSPKEHGAVVPLIANSSTLYGPAAAPLVFDLGPTSVFASLPLSIALLSPPPQPHTVTVPLSSRTAPSGSVGIPTTITSVKPFNYGTAPSPTVPSSLVCTEPFLAASPPASAVAAATDDRLTAVPALRRSSLPSTSSGSKTVVVADLWMPPRELPPAPRTGSGAVTDSSSPSDVVLRRQSVVAKRGASEPGATRFCCKFCPGVTFATARDLDIHLHSDHVLMRDGAFFKCPKPNCDTLFPTRQNLRNHLASHFHGYSVCHNGFANGRSGTEIVSTDSDGSAKMDLVNSKHTVAAALNRKLAILSADSTTYASLTTPDKKSYCRRVSMSSARSHCDCSKCTKNSDCVGRPGRASVPGAMSSNSPLLGAVGQSPWTPLSDSDVSRLSVVSAGGTASPTPPQQQPSLPFTAVRQDTVVSQRSSSEKRSSVLFGKRRTDDVDDGYATDAKFMRTDVAAAVVNGEMSSSFDEDVNVDVELDDGEVPLDGQNAQETVALRDLRCIVCGGQLFSALALQRHILASHLTSAGVNVLQPPPPPPERPYFCSFCDAAFTSRQALQAHAPCRPEVLAEAAKRRHGRRTETVTSQRDGLAK